MEMTIYYKKILESVLRDMTLTDAERSLLMFLVTKPPGWTFHEDTLVTETGRTRNWLRMNMRSLRKKGYLSESPAHGKDGKFAQWGSVLNADTVLAISRDYHPMAQPPDGKPTPLSHNGQRSHDGVKNHNGVSHDGRSHHQVVKPPDGSPKNKGQDDLASFVASFVDTSKKPNDLGTSTFADPWADHKPSAEVSRTTAEVAASDSSFDDHRKQNDLASFDVTSKKPNDLETAKHVCGDNTDPWCECYVPESEGCEDVDAPESTWVENFREHLLKTHTEPAEEIDQEGVGG
jgi:hypothetical protein